MKFCHESAVKSTCRYFIHCTWPVEGSFEDLTCLRKKNYRHPVINLYSVFITQKLVHSLKEMSGRACKVCDGKCSNSVGVVRKCDRSVTSC